MILLWYAITLITAIIVAPFLEQRYSENKLTKEKYGFLGGLAFSSCIAVLSLFLYKFGKALGEMLASEYILAFVSIISMHGLCMYALSPLSGKLAHRLIFNSISLIFALVFLLNPESYNNLALCVLTVGVTSRLSFQINKNAFSLIFVLMALFDAYSVWMSDIMQKIIWNYPNITPSGLLHFAMTNMKFLGAGDVIFSTIAVVFIRRQSSNKIAFLMALILILAIALLDQITWRPFNPNSFPCMVLISPIAFLFLIFTGRPR